ncbi:MAG: hypothetical protein ABI647_03710 [Gemmatimonadota bacterium]
MKHAVAVILGFAGFALGCGDPFKLGPATITNTIDTLALFSVNGTALNKPSAYNLSVKSAVLLGIDATSTFDFLYYRDPVKGDVFLPLAAVNKNLASATGQAGFLRATETFDNIKVAQQVGYSSTDTVKIAVGDVLYVHSSNAICVLGIPYYAKLQILSIDAVERSVVFKILINTNCGYRGLEQGLPGT